MDTINDVIIEGVTVTHLKMILDERGGVYHIIKKSSPTFNEFGEAYISKVNYGIIKAWKYHKNATQNLSLPYGKLKLVLYDDRTNSSTRGLLNEFILDQEKNYNLITIPKKIWYGFQCIRADYCLLLNVTDIEHDPTESINLPVTNDLIAYNWNIND